MKEIIIDNKTDLFDMAKSLKKLDFCKSTNEAIRLLKQNAVSIYKNREWYKIKVVEDITAYENPTKSKEIG
ncbi:MAG TPA: hypothetical protein PKI46_06985 [Bacteroidales bacterium]|jgi:GTP cyclohydrolase II|nr:hypothetical protein [Bacteroidales bacterium]